MGLRIQEQEGSNGTENGKGNANWDVQEYVGYRVMRALASSLLVFNRNDVERTPGGQVRPKWLPGLSRRNNRWCTWQVSLALSNDDPHNLLPRTPSHFLGSLEAPFILETPISSHEAEIRFKPALYETLAIVTSAGDEVALKLELCHAIESWNCHASPEPS